MPLISCRDVNIKYDSVTAVHGACFDLDKGDYLCVIGENGSGKSTLMKGILGLASFSGKIEFTGIKPAEIGYMPQQSDARRDFPASVYEVVVSGCLNRRRSIFYGKAEKERARVNMKRLGIERLEKKPYNSLSKGQQQRALLARALCASERLLMLDEPAAGLDPVGASEMYALLDTLNRDGGMAIMMVSHDIKSALKYSGKILHMGTAPLFFGTREAYTRTELCSAMLGGK